MKFIRTPGEGAVIARRRIYPRVKLIIQNITFEVLDEAGADIYVEKAQSFKFNILCSITAISALVAKPSA